MITSIDEFQGKRMMQSGAQVWLARHRPELQKFTDEHISYESRDEFISFAFSKGCFITQMLLKHVLMDDKAKFTVIADKLLKQRGRLDIIVGAKDSGKTHLGYGLANKLHRIGEKVYWLGIPCDLPGFIAGQSMDLAKIPPNCTVLLDEAGLMFYTRDSSQDEALKKLAAERHKGRNLIVIMQHMKIADIEFFRLVDSFFFTSYSFIQDEHHRIRLTDELKAFMPTKKGDCLYIDNYDMIFFHKELEDWWLEKYSTPFRSFRSPGEAYRFMVKLFSELKDDEIVEQMALKDFRADEFSVSKVRQLYENTPEMLKLSDTELEKYVAMGFNDLSLNDLADYKTDVIKGNFQLGAMAALALKEQFRQRPDFALKSSFNINDYFLSEVAFNLKEGMDLKYSLTGRPGTRKSSSSLSLMLLIYQLMGKEPQLLVFADKEKIIEYIEKFKPQREVIILDEVLKKSGEGSGRQIKEFENIEKALRQHQLHFIHNSTDPENVMHYYILETAGYDTANKTAKLLVFTPQGTMKKDCLGYITLKEPPAAAWAEYSLTKQKILESVEGRQTSRRTDISTIVQKIMRHEDYEFATNKRQMESILVEVAPHLGTAEKDLIIGKLELLRKKESA